MLTYAREIYLTHTPALSHTGAVAFISAADIPAGGSNHAGEVVADEEVFASKEVHAVGQLVGLMIGRSLIEAAAAARLIKVWRARGSMVFAHRPPLYVFTPSHLDWHLPLRLRPAHLGFPN